MTSFINMHSYLLLNAAIAFGFIITKSIAKLPYFNHVLPIQRLKYVRYSFLIIIVMAFALPHILTLFNYNQSSTFQLQPMLRSAYSNIQSYVQVEKPIVYVNKQSYSLPIYELFLVIISIIIITGLINYVKNIYSLNKMKKSSFCKHAINRVHILFNDKLSSPFCWSFFKGHYIAFPSYLLENASDLKLALRHELQHIRQKDTYWLHFMFATKCICFWNPLIKAWINWLNELQEFACDQAIVVKKKVPPEDYAQSLINIAKLTLQHHNIPQGALGMQGNSPSILYRRVNMLFDYKKGKSMLMRIVAAYIISFLSAISLAYALNTSSVTGPLSSKQVQDIINKSHIDKSFQVSATKEVVEALNNIITSDKARMTMRESLKRMKQYQSHIESELKKQSMPTDLLVIPLAESAYQPLDQSKNPVLAAGIWQIIPSTAKRFGLTIDENRDDRLDTLLSTQAALTYLNQNYSQFNNWKLACVAYEIGEAATAKLIEEVGSKDAWELALSPKAPADLKRFLALLDSELIIMHNPALIS